jgi:hypothetical protein
MRDTSGIPAQGLQPHALRLHARPMRCDRHGVASFDTLWRTTAPRGVYGFSFMDSRASCRPRLGRDLAPGRDRHEYPDLGSGVIRGGADDLVVDALLDDSPARSSCPMRPSFNQPKRCTTISSNSAGASASGLKRCVIASARCSAPRRAACRSSLCAWTAPAMSPRDNRPRTSTSRAWAERVRCGMYMRLLRRPTAF